MLSTTGPTANRTCDGARVLDWIASSEAQHAAGVYLRRSGFPSAEGLAEDVVGEAALNVVKQQARNRLSVDNPAAYGTTIIKNVVYGLTRRETDHLDERDLPAVWDVVDEPAADDIRVIIGSNDSCPWLTAAALTYLTLLMYPAAVPEDVPTPVAGARADQARVWPSLWLAGIRDLFPDPCPDKVRRRRARRIAEVLNHVERVFAEYRLELDRDNG